MSSYWFDFLYLTFGIELKPSSYLQYPKTRILGRGGRTPERITENQGWIEPFFIVIENYGFRTFQKSFSTKLHRTPPSASECCEKNCTVTIFSAFLPHASYGELQPYEK